MWNRQELWPLNTAHVLNQRIVKSFCFWLLTDVLTQKSNASPGRPNFGSNSPLYGAWHESNAWGLPGGGGGGGMGGFGIDWDIRDYQAEQVKKIDWQKTCKSHQREMSELYAKDSSSALQVNRYLVSHLVYNLSCCMSFSYNFLLRSMRKAICIS